MIKNLQKKQIQKSNVVKIFNENVILIDPNVDASEKEIYARNGFRFESQNLKSYAAIGSLPQYKKAVFMPTKFG